ncbi:MAG: hypothetical protein KQH59_15370 [Desulfobulbaceae bacterium]|nr:hypothetical protein [Desulfobulbaceae bacterium]
MNSREQSRTIVERFGRFKGDSSHCFNPSGYCRDTVELMKLLSRWTVLSRLRDRLRDIPLEGINEATSRRLVEDTIGSQDDRRIDWARISEFLKRHHERAV